MRNADRGAVERTAAVMTSDSRPRVLTRGSPQREGGES